MTPSRQTSRALRRAQEEFRRDQRRYVRASSRRAQSAELLVGVAVIRQWLTRESRSRFFSSFFSLSRVKLLLEKQKHRYDAASRVVEEEAEVRMHRTWCLR